MTTEERFNNVAPLLSLDGEDVVADLERGRNYAHYKGKLWINDNWLSVSEARRLRDWLNELIP